MTLHSEVYRDPEFRGKAWPNRSLRRTDRAVETELAYLLLHTARVGRLASAGEDGPYITPLCYVYTPANKICFHSASTGHKLDNLDGDPRVCFEVDAVWNVTSADRACGYGIEYFSIVIFGVAKRVTDSEKALGILALLMDKYGGGNHPLVSKDDISQTVVVSIDVSYMSAKSNLTAPTLLDRLSPLVTS